MSAIDIVANLDAVKASIRKALGTADREAEAVELIAVSKTFDVDHILPVLQAGHRVFGENRVQEAASKWPGLKRQFSGICLHLIGPLQTNKALEAVTLFDVIETIDRPKLAEKLTVAMEKVGKRPDCLVQVNTGEENQKAGVAPRDTAAFVRQCQDEFGLPIKGLMCIPPAQESPAPHFALVHKLAEQMGLPIISMGMSADYQIACQLGATHVRVGSSIFGQRS